MIAIAICDDENDIINQIEQYILNSQILPVNQSAGACEIEAYYSGASLCASLDAGRYFDLIYMDIKTCQVKSSPK